VDTFWSNVLSILVGGAITFVSSYLFYVRASRDLETEAVRLRTIANTIARALVEAGMAEIMQDRNGDMTGLTLHGRAVLRGESSVACNPTVSPSVAPCSRLEHQSGQG